MRYSVRWAFWGGLAAIWSGLDPMPAGEQAETRGAVATVYLVGDSTVKNGTDRGSGSLWGWGHYLGERIDPARYRVENRALGGRSSRTFRTEGLWARVVKQLQPGDYVLIQFGHNDGGPVDSERGRASLKGVGEEVVTVTHPGKPDEVVHSYGWYIRQYVAETQARGATPIVLSPIPRNIWSDDGKVKRARRDYGLWAQEAAEAEHAAFVDLNRITADRYDTLGRERVGLDLFTPTDHTHTTAAGARINAESVANGLRTLDPLPIAAALIEPPPAP